MGNEDEFLLRQLADVHLGPKPMYTLSWPPEDWNPLVSDADLVPVLKEVLLAGWVLWQGNGGGYGVSPDYPDVRVFSLAGDLDLNRAVCKARLLIHTPSPPNTEEA